MEARGEPSDEVNVYEFLRLKFIFKLMKWFIGKEAGILGVYGVGKFCILERRECELASVPRLRYIYADIVVARKFWGMTACSVEVCIKLVVRALYLLKKL